MVALAILALLVFGPEGLPGVVKKVMRTIHALRTAASDFQTEVRSALEEENQRLDEQKRRGSRTAETFSHPTETVDEETACAPPENDSMDSLEVPDTDSDLESSPTEPIESEEPLKLTEENLPALENEAVQVAENSEPESLDDDDDGPGLPMKRPERSVEA